MVIYAFWRGLSNRPARGTFIACSGTGDCGGQVQGETCRGLVGIDISKHRHEVLIAAPGKTRRRRLTITNGTGDFMRLIAILREYGMPARIGFEATGNYHRVLMYHLGVAGFDLKLVSSVALARTRDALHNSWDKNDPKDA